VQLTLPMLSIACRVTSVTNQLPFWVSTQTESLHAICSWVIWKVPYFKKNESFRILSIFLSGSKPSRFDQIYFMKQKSIGFFIFENFPKLLAVLTLSLNLSTLKRRWEYWHYWRGDELSRASWILTQQYFFWGGGCYFGWRHIRGFKDIRVQYSSKGEIIASCWFFPTIEIILNSDKDEKHRWK